jgi:hypothetical protein
MEKGQRSEEEGGSMSDLELVNHKRWPSSGHKVKGRDSREEEGWRASRWK